ncbi:MAG: DUF2726 domain-containing protein [Clostridia bacterium]|nr:DUF2726 domain-containing protein [Clostridia bacterium]
MNIGTIIIILFIIYVILKWLYDQNIIFPHSEEKKVNIFSAKINEKLLTNNELEFFNKLKIITDEYNLLIFTKVRLADIFKANDKSSLGRIQSKHIDFIVCDNETRPIKFIELDDSTHNKKSISKNEKKLLLLSLSF